MYRMPQCGRRYPHGPFGAADIADIEQRRSPVWPRLAAARTAARKQRRSAPSQPHRPRSSGETDFLTSARSEDVSELDADGAVSVALSILAGQQARRRVDIRRRAAAVVGACVCCGDALLAQGRGAACPREYSREGLGLKAEGCSDRRCALHCIAEDYLRHTMPCDTGCVGVGPRKADLRPEVGASVVGSPCCVLYCEY